MLTSACVRSITVRLPVWVKEAAEPLYYLSLEEMARRIASREISPVAVTQQMLTRIARVDPVLKSYATLMADQAIPSKCTRVTPQQLAAAREKRAAFSAQFTKLLDSVDAMAGPAGGVPAWPITHEIQVGPLPAYHEAWSKAAPRSAEFTLPMDLAGVPAICLPCGFRRTVCRTASSSLDDDSAKRRCAVSLMRLQASQPPRKYLS